MRSRLTTLAPAASVATSIRPSTCAGTPDSSRCGGGPRRAGQFLRTSSWLPPIPPDVTTTAWAVNSKGSTSTRELASPRATPLGSRTCPRTPVTAPPLTTRSSTRGLRGAPPRGGARAAADHELVDGVAEAQPHEAAVGGGLHAAGERRHDPGPGAPDDVEAGDGVAVPGRGVAAALGPADDREEPAPLLPEPGPLLPRRAVPVGLGPLARPPGLPATAPPRADPVPPRQVERGARPP